MAPNFEPHECVIFVHFTKTGTHENEGIHSMSPAVALIVKCDKSLEKCDYQTD